MLCYSTGEDYKQVLEVNVVGPFLVTKHFLPQLQKKATKVVVNTSSICGSISANAAGRINGRMLPYNSSKAAINMRKLTQKLQNLVQHYIMLATQYMRHSLFKSLILTSIARLPSIHVSNDNT